MLKADAAEPDHEFYKLHLVGSFLVNNRVDQCLHTLCEDDTALHLGNIYFTFTFSQNFTALLQGDILLFIVREAVVNFLDLRLVLLKNVVDLHVVALEATEGFTVHLFGVRENVV